MEKKYTLHNVLTKITEPVRRTDGTESGRGGSSCTRLVTLRLVSREVAAAAAAIPPSFSDPIYRVNQSRQAAALPGDLPPAAGRRVVGTRVSWVRKDWGIGAVSETVRRREGHGPQSLERVCACAVVA